MLNNISKQPMKTEWVTAANISGTGTTVVGSASMHHNYSDLPSFNDFAIEFEFAFVVTAGSGFALAWTSVTDANPYNMTETDNAPSLSNYTRRIINTTNTGKRRILVKFNAVQESGNTAIPNRISTTVRGRGSAADTEWEISGIRSRLIYNPID